MVVTFKDKFFFAAPAFGIILALFLFSSGGENTHHLWDEGHLTEIVTEFGYFAALIIFLKLAIEQNRGYLKFWFIFWMLCSLVFFGEETSWLQHYIKFQTPEALEQINTQEEFNLHNLDFLQSHSIHENGFSLRSIFTAQHMFQIGFLAYFLILPIICKFGFFKNIAEKLSIPLPGINVIAFIWIPVFTTIILALLSLSNPETKSAMAECREMFYGMGIGIFAISSLLTLRYHKI